MIDLSPELKAVTAGLPAEASAQALRRERREIFSVRPELLITLYVAVATLVAGVGLLIKANLDRIGPVALLTGILVAAALCYLVTLRARWARRERSLGENYVLLLGALLFSTAIGYAEVKFRLFGTGWSRHLLLLSVWHFATAYWLNSRLVLAVALTSFAGWVGVETRLGALWDSPHPLLGAGPRALLCALLFWAGGRVHHYETDPRQGFREVYLQFAANLAFWGALALGGKSDTRWIGALILLVLAFLVGRAGLREKRQSFLLYAVGYTTIGLIWLQALVVGPLMTSWLGLFTVIGAVFVLMRLRSRLRESTE